MKRWIIAAVVLVIIASTAAVVYTRRNRTEIQVQTTPLSRGDIVDTVGATGTLQAVTTVQVGSQVSGNISWLGADFNSIVKKGQVLARLDPSIIQADIDRDTGQLSTPYCLRVMTESFLDGTQPTQFCELHQ